jgi:chloramphenicol 3-O-phosphotransferase
VETVFRDAEQLAVCHDTLAAVPHVVVRLVCDRAVRLARERQRVDRRPGVSEASAQAEVIPADLAATLDTTAATPDELATVLLALL